MKKTKVSISRFWTLVLCSLSAVLLAITASCKSSRKVQKAEADAKMQTEIRIREIKHESDSLQKILDRRRNSVMYGTPELMQRAAEENRKMQARIIELDQEAKELQSTLK